MNLEEQNLEWRELREMSSGELEMVERVID